MLYYFFHPFPFLEKNLRNELNPRPLGWRKDFNHCIILFLKKLLCIKYNYSINHYTCVIKKMFFFHVQHCIINVLNWVPHLTHYHCLVFVDFQRIKGPRNFETSKGEKFKKPWQPNNQQWNFFQVFSKLLLSLSNQKFNFYFIFKIWPLWCVW
jgi:hypothetical protein